MSIRFEPIAGATLERMLERKCAEIDAVQTPFPGWNAVCGEEGGGEGLAKRWVVIIGGVTGTGKSYLLSNLVARAVMDGKLVGMLNFEMSQMAVATRYLSILSGIPKYKLEMGRYFNEKAWIKAKNIADEKWAAGGALISNESSVFSIDHITEAYEKLVAEGVEMIGVDYAQLVTVEGASNIHQRSEAVANRLRELTHYYNVTTVAISQFNREEAKRGKPPTIHGLLGGGIWEHTANQIFLLDHTVRYKWGVNPGGGPKGEFTKLLGLKNRHGLAPIELPMRWNYDNMRWDEYVPHPDDDHPFDDDQEAVTVAGKEPSEESVDLFEEE